jgi:3-deoxy-D-manno-octulosonic-acid transferase
LPTVGLFSKKLKTFTKGRSHVLEDLASENLLQKKLVWFHAASLGEYEQGLPIMEKIKATYPSYELLLTFFSPSGYEVKKHSSVADYVYYLPLDTPSNAQKFIALTKPKLAMFIKYEIWPNYLDALKKAQIPSLLISGVFRKEQIYFKSYGRFLFKALQKFDYLFVQNSNSLQVLKEQRLQNCAISGDTRFDRVLLQLQKDNKLDFIEKFKNGKELIVYGSTWPEDEALISAYINTSSTSEKHLIAPHQMKVEKIEKLKNSINKKVLLFSKMEGKNPKDYNVLILDTIGLLTKAYSYASIAYIGGGMGSTGLHNILEPAVFGIPIIIGKHYEKFPEAKDLIELGGCISISNEQELRQVLQNILTNSKLKNKKGLISQTFIYDNNGATEFILKYLYENRIL